MKKLMFVVALAAAIVGPVVAHAEETAKADDWVWSPFSISFAAPVQVPWTTTSIYGLRLTGFLGLNDEVRGMSCGLANAASGETMGFELGGVNAVFDTAMGAHVAVVNYANAFMGLQLGGLNWVNTETYGCQLAVLNCDQGPFTGAGIGLINHATRADGLQFGFMNFAYEASGLQLGVINACDYMRGVQIGLVNLICESQLPMMVIANASF